jgi:hypothetical protein
MPDIRRASINIGQKAGTFRIGRYAFAIGESNGHSRIAAYVAGRMGDENERVFLVLK